MKKALLPSPLTSRGPAPVISGRLARIRVSSANTAELITAPSRPQPSRPQPQPSSAKAAVLSHLLGFLPWASHQELTRTESHDLIVEAVERVSQEVLTRAC